MTHRVALVFAVVSFFISCAVMPPERATSTQRTSAPEQPPATTRPAAPSRTAERPGSELDTGVFAKLPAETKTYLAAVSRAAASGDVAFLLAQGELDYARRTRVMLDADAYAAALYRIGEYSNDSPAGGGRPTRFNLAQTASIRYTGWAERGPLFEIRGKIRFRDGSEESCTLYVLWKLDPPRILGAEP
jgi:hypothetical protein